MNARPVEYKITILKACGLALLLLLTLSLTVCTSMVTLSEQMYPPQLVGQADAAGHAPVILRVDDRSCIVEHIYT